MAVPKDRSYDELCAFFMKYIREMEPLQKKLFEKFIGIRFTEDMVYSSQDISGYSLSKYNYMVMELIVYHIRNSTKSYEIKDLLKQILIINYNNIRRDFTDYIINASEVYTFFYKKQLLRYLDAKHLHFVIQGKDGKLLRKMKFMLFQTRFCNVINV